MTKNILDEKFEGDVDYDLMLGDVKNLNMQKMKNVFDLVVMNPPFGTKEEGLDYVFLKQAFEICNGNVYSFHKTSTRPVFF